MVLYAPSENAVHSFWKSIQDFHFLWEEPGNHPRPFLTPARSVQASKRIEPSNGLYKLSSRKNILLISTLSFKRGSKSIAKRFWGEFKNPGASTISSPDKTVAAFLQDAFSMPHLRMRFTPFHTTTILCLSGRRKVHRWIGILFPYLYGPELLFEFHDIILKCA